MLEGRKEKGRGVNIQHLLVVRLLAHLLLTKPGRDEIAAYPTQTCIMSSLHKRCAWLSMMPHLQMHLIS